MRRYRESPDFPTRPTRWQLIRDIVSLQVKLLVDGFRDFLLVPVSLVAGAISLLRPGTGAGTEFYSLLKLGRKSDHWIDLFSAARRIEADGSAADTGDAAVDDMIARLESFVVKEYQDGEVTRQAREHIEQMLNSLKGKKPGGE